jgi:hypothetical protein
MEDISMEPLVTAHATVNKVTVGIFAKYPCLAN